MPFLAFCGNCRGPIRFPYLLHPQDDFVRVFPNAEAGRHFTQASILRRSGADCDSRKFSDCDSFRFRHCDSLKFAIAIRLSLVITIRVGLVIAIHLGFLIAIRVSLGARNACVHLMRPPPQDGYGRGRGVKSILNPIGGREGEGKFASIPESS